MTIYNLLLTVLVKWKTRLKIVVVGANDGKTNDPVYEFAMAHGEATDMILVEPNRQMIPYLEQNYARHPSHLIANCAVGNNHTLTLYAVKQSYWSQFKPEYARGWPEYRAATGITSSVESHVKQALEKENVSSESAVEVLQVRSLDLCNLLVELEQPRGVDVLQIDAEGCDDLVLYASSLSKTKPLMIYFESHNLDKARLKKLKIYLRGLSYTSFRSGGDRIAIATNRGLLSFVAIVILIGYTIKRKITKWFRVNPS